MIIKLLSGTNIKLIDISLLLLRCTIGVILFIIGAEKLFGWFGGSGIVTTIQSFEKMGFSLPLTYLSCYTEFIGGFLLTVGFMTRPAAIAVMINMIVATIVMIPNGFIGAGHASYPFIFLIIDIVIILTGPMHLSLDAKFLKVKNVLENKSKDE